MLYVMLFDYMFGKGIKSGGAVKRLIVAHKESLDSVLTKVKAEASVSDNHELIPASVRSSATAMKLLPRYARVNTLLTSMEDVYRRLEEEPASHPPKLDPDVNTLLVFPPGTELHEHSLVRQWNPCSALDDPLMPVGLDLLGEDRPPYFAGMNTSASSQQQPQFTDSSPGQGILFPGPHSVVHVTRRS